MKSRRLDAILVSSTPGVRYLSGFTGSTGLCVVTPRRAFFLTDSRYTLQSKGEVSPAFTRIPAHRGLFEEVARSGVLPRKGVVGFEADDLTVLRYRNLKRLLPGYVYRPLSGLFENLRSIKEREEIASISAAVRISDRVFESLLQEIRPGARECDVAARISFLHRSSGADGDAFDPIVASGPRGAIPHARATRRRIRKGEMVVLDFGCTVGGYRSDLTRTIAIGKPSREMRDVYSVVLDAQNEAIGAARAGLIARDLDGVARRRIAAAGYGRRFTHSLGHGLGLHLHERPRISSLSLDRLRPGMVITIEPGVYLPGKGGVRIEDDVVIHTSGCRVLTAAPKELLVL